MDAFPTLEEDSFAERIAIIDGDYEAATRKQQLIERLAFVLVSTCILFGGVIAMERHEKRMAIINQESLAWNR